MSYTIDNHEDGNLDILRALSFLLKFSVKQATSYCTGVAVVPWTWMKAVHHLLDGLPGHHVVWWRMPHNIQIMQRSSSSQQQWSPGEDELLKGVEYISTAAPDQDDENQQYVWIPMQIKPDSVSPIAGWPKSEVRLLAQNKACSRWSYFIQPLVTMSFKPFMGTFLLPLLYPMRLSVRVITIGWPGVGKTPLLLHSPEPCPRSSSCQKAHFVLVGVGLRLSTTSGTNVDSLMKDSYLMIQL